MATPCFAPVLRSLEWRSLGTGSVVAISLWTGQWTGWYSVINRALNESLRTANSTRRRGKGKMGPLEGALRITYRGNDVQVWDEDCSVTGGSKDNYN